MTSSSRHKEKMPRLVTELNPHLPDTLVACVMAEKQAATAAVGLMAVAGNLLYYQPTRDGQLGLTICHLDRPYLQSDLAII